MRRMFSLKQLQEIADSEVKTLVEGGTLNNAKAIYYHPIYVLGKYNNVDCRFSFVILDNNSTPYNATTVITKVKALMDAGAYIQVNGYIATEANKNFSVFLMVKSGSDYTILGNTVTEFTNAIMLDSITINNLNDGVNKIN